MESSKRNLFDDIPATLPDELTEVLMRARGARVERIVSRGHRSPDGFWYDQSEDEWVVLLAGAARLEFEHDTIDLQPGDHVLIPARRRHRVAWTAPDADTIWLAVFVPASSS